MIVVPPDTNNVPSWTLRKGAAMSNLAIINTDEPEHAADLDFDEDERRDLAKEVTSIFKAWKLSLLSRLWYLALPLLGELR